MTLGLPLEYQKIAQFFNARNINKNTGAQNAIIAKIFHNKFALQIYSLQELKDILTSCGIKNIKQYALDRSEFFKNSTVRILAIAQNNVSNNARN